MIINAAHFLVMKNKDVYRFYQTEPFLETVRKKDWERQPVHNMELSNNALVLQ